MVAALRSLLVATALLAVFATTAAAQDPPCDRTWNGTSGNWNDGSRWSGGFAPGASERGCLPAGSYTVTVTGGTSPKGITVGTGVTVLIKQFQYLDARSANFLNRGTVRLEQNAALYGPLVNDGTVEDTGEIPAGNNRPSIIGSVTSSGTIRANQGLNLQRDGGAVESTGRLETANASALLNGWGYPDGTWTISGTIVNPGTMQFQAGTMRVRAFASQTGNAFRTYDSKLDLTGASGTVETNNTVDLTTDIPAGMTVRAMGRTNDAYLRLDANRTNNGTLVFDSADANRSTVLTGVSGSPRLTNTGTLRAAATTGNDRNFRIPITNAASGTVTVDAGTRMVFQIDAGETISAGSWTVDGNLWVQGGNTQITQTGGAIAIAGTVFFTGSRYVHQGGTVTGELQFQNSASIDPSGPGAATYHVVGYVTLAGDVNAAATINVEASGGQPGTLTLTGPRTMAGRLNFTTGGANAQDTDVNGLNGATPRLTVTGRIDVQRGQGGTRHFSVPLTIAAGAQFNVEALATAFVNGNGNTLDHQIAGNVSVAGGGLLLFRIATQTVTQTAGTITATGSFNVEGNTFVHQGGNVVGLVTVSSGGVRGRLDPSGPGTAAYIIRNSVNLIADVNVDADIQVAAADGGGALYVRDRDVTNRGTMQVGPEGSTYGGGLYDDGQPYTVTNAGAITTGKGSQRELNVRLVNTGTLIVNDLTTGISSITDKPLVTNSGGTVTINKAGFTTWRGYTQTSGLTDLDAASLGSPRNPADILIQGGRVRGTGIIYGPVTNSASLEVGRPGTPFGKLQIKDVVDQIVRVAASYSQTATGRLAVDVGGTTAGTSLDQLSVDGPATLGGALDIATAAGYTPNPATPDKYRVLLSETRANAFADVTGARLYTVGYDTTGAELTARVPPPPSAEVSIADASVVEGAGPLTFTAKLSKASTDPVTVDWTTEDDTASAPGDYTASSGTLTFAPNTTTQTFTVPVTNDAVDEPVKQLVVRLRHPVNATLDVATALGRIDPDDVGITGTAPTRVGNAGPATIAITGGGFAAGTTAKLPRAGEADRIGGITSGPVNQSKLAARFDMRGAAQGGWTLTVRTPSGATATAPVTVQNGPPALYAVLTVPPSLRYGWIARATLSLRNAGANDVGIDAVRFLGNQLEVRALGDTTFSSRVSLSGDQLGDAVVLPALSTRTVAVEVRSTTTVGHAQMGLDAEVFPAGYLSQTIRGSDPDPGTGSIAGRVTNAAGHPVRDLRVTAFDGTHSASAKTDGGGAYVLKPLKPGTYSVQAGSAKGSAAVAENARTVDLVTGVADISGTVGKGDATVALLLRSGTTAATTQADATGAFRFRVARAGEYTLVADSPASGRASQALTVVAGVDQPGLKLTLGARALQVTTTAGATVRVWPAGEEALPSTGVATGGAAAFSALPAGALTVEVRAAGKAPTRATVAAGATAVTVTPANASTIGGRVTQAGAPVESASIVAAAGGARYFAVSGADGRYTLAGLPAGSYDVWVMAPGAAPLVKRAVAAGAANADAAVVTTGATLDVKVSGGAVGRLVQVVDPATGIAIAAGGTVGPDANAHFGALPAGTYTLQGAGAEPRTVTLGGGGKLARAAAAAETITLDDEGYPVVADPEPDPAYEEYTSPFSGLKAPKLNEKDRLGWDQVLPDYPGPCPTADRIYDTIQLKQKAKLLAFSSWVDAWDAVDTQNRADIERLMTLSSQFAANSFLALATLGEAPPGMSYAAAGLLGNVANYIGTMHQSKLGLLDPLAAVDYAQYFKDAVDTAATLMSEGGSPIELNYLSSIINVLRGMIDLSDQARAFPAEVAARANGYLEAQERYERLLREINDLLHDYDEAKKHCPEQVDRGPKAPVITGGSIENITSNDPNELLGPAGVGASRWIPRSQALGYMIRFENLAPGSVIPPGQQPASAPATVVKVVTTLSPSVDVDAVTLGNVGWGAVELSVPAGLTTYHKDVPLTDGDIVRIDGALNKATRTITWTLKTIDPATGEIDGSPTAGFLPPEDGTRRGQGHVDYQAGTPDTVAQGTAIAAKATITFDVNTPIETNTHTNTVDGTAPAATLTLGTPSCDGKLPVAWTGTDTGSGVAAYDVEVSSDGELSWKPWLSGVSTTSGTYPGVPGQTYAFRVMARDAVGNQEATPATADATKTLGACDLQAPRTTATLPDGAVGGWYGGPVDVKLDAVDAPGGSGVAGLRHQGIDVTGSTATSRIAAEGITDLVFAARDVAGNVEAAAHLPVRIDTTPPAIAGTDGAAYALGQAAALDATCADAGVGVASCAVPAALDTSAPGAFAFTVTAADKLGHTASRTFAYTVSAPAGQPSPPGGGGNPPAPPAPAFGKAPVKVKLGKVTRSAVALTLTSTEKFAFTGKATLLTTAKNPKAQSETGSFSLAAGKSGKLTLKLKQRLRAGKKLKLILRLELASGAARKVVDVRVTLRAR